MAFWGNKFFSRFNFNDVLSKGVRENWVFLMYGRHGRIGFRTGGTHLRIKFGILR